MARRKAKAKTDVSMVRDAGEVLVMAGLGRTYTAKNADGEYEPREVASGELFVMHADHVGALAVDGYIGIEEQDEPEEE